MRKTFYLGSRDELIEVRIITFECLTVKGVWNPNAGCIGGVEEACSEAGVSEREHLE